MIYTVTFNPAWDYVIGIDNINLGKVNRTTFEEIHCGGKGINVSTVLNNLGFDNIALGFVAGFTGIAFEQALTEQGIKNDFIHLKNGMTRINVKMKSSEETEINGLGPKVDNDELKQLFLKLDEIKNGDILVLAGSIPSTLPSNIYEKIMARLDGKNINFVVDATKDLILNVLKYRPFLIKPNNFELGEMFSKELNSHEEIIFYGKKLQEMGARNVLVSMAEDGAILLTEDGEIKKLSAFKGKVVNSVGAGDSMVAGFIAGYSQSNDLFTALKMGVAAGSASAFSKILATKDEIMNLYNQI